MERMSGVGERALLNVATLITFLVLWAVVVVVPLSPSTHPIHDNSGHVVCDTENKSAEPQESLWHWMFHDAITIYTLFLTAFTGLLAIATFKLWNSTERLVIGAEDAAAAQSRAMNEHIRVAQNTADYTSDMVDRLEDNAIIQLRAYIHYKTAGRQDSTKGGYWAFKVIVRNFGQTPAYKVTMWIGITDVVSHDFSGPFPYPPENLRKSKSIIAPSAELSFYIPMVSKVSQDEFRALIEGKQAIFIYGVIGYRDIFKKRHETQYRIMFTGEGVLAGILMPAEEGNEAT